nr:MAG TPA: hypothetical protein [Caudoviricetes sp.]
MIHTRYSFQRQFSGQNSLVMLGYFVYTQLK